MFTNTELVGTLHGVVVSTLNVPLGELLSVAPSESANTPEIVPLLFNVPDCNVRPPFTAPVVAAIVTVALDAVRPLLMMPVKAVMVVPG